MHCPKCATPNPRGAVRCKKCGAQLPRLRKVVEQEEEEDDGAVSTIIPYRNVSALLGYYCGVFGLIPGVGFVLGPIGLILGIVGLLYVQKHPSAKGTGHALAGIFLGALGILISIVFVILLKQGIISFPERP